MTDKACKLMSDTLHGEKTCGRLHTQPGKISVMGGVHHARKTSINTPFLLKVSGRLLGN